MASPSPPAGLLRFVALDLAVAAWVVVWLVVGALAGLEIRELSTYSDTLVTAGDALNTAGSALQWLGSVPLVGDGPGRLGDEVRTLADEVTRTARSTHDTVTVLSVLVGASIALVPTRGRRLPPLALVAPSPGGRRPPGALPLWSR